MKKILWTLCFTLLFAGGVAVMEPAHLTAATASSPVHLNENQPKEADGWIYLNKKSFNYNLSKVDFNGKQTSLAKDVIAYGSYLVKGDYVYYNNPKDGDKLYRVKKDGTDNKLFINSKDRITDVQDHVILVQDEKTYQSKVLDAKTKKELMRTTDYLSVQSDGYAYYNNYNDNNAIYRMTLKGTGKTKVVEPKKNEFIYNYAVQNKNFYFMTQSGLYSKAEGSKTVKTVLASKIDAGFFVKNNAVYKDGTSKKIYAYDLATGKRTDLGIKNSKDVYPIPCGDGVMYYDNANMDKRVYVSLDGKKKMTRGDVNSRTTMLAGDASGVYVTEATIQSGIFVSKDGGKSYTTIVEDNAMDFIKVGNLGFYVTNEKSVRNLKVVDLQTKAVKTVETNFVGYMQPSSDNVLYYTQNNKWYQYDITAGKGVEMTKYSRIVSVNDYAVGITTNEDSAVLLEGSSPKVISKDRVVVRTLYDYSGYLDTVDGKTFSYFDQTKSSLGYFDLKGTEGVFTPIESANVTGAKAVAGGIIYVVGNPTDYNASQAYKFNVATGNKLKLDTAIKNVYDLQIKGDKIFHAAYESDTIKISILGADGKLTSILSKEKFFAYNLESDFIIIMKADSPTWILYDLEGKKIKDLTKDLGNATYLPAVAKLGNTLYIDINNQYGRYLKMVDLSK